MSQTLSRSQYDGYNYHDEFWGDGKRQYEDTIEKQTLTRLIRKLPNVSEAVLLDCGAGYGRLACIYAALVKHAYLIDYSQEMINQATQHCKEYTNLTLTQGDIYQLPMADNAVDIMISIRTLHHIRDIKKI